MYNILVCDADRDIVSALELYLTAEGYRAIPAYSGQEALEVFAREEIHYECTKYDGARNVEKTVE